MKLLIVDGDETVRRVLAWVAAMDHWEAHMADQHADIPQLLRTANIDLLLIDHLMRPKNGLQIIREIREHHISIPVILLTVDPGLIRTLDTSSLNIHRIIPKPPDVWEFRAALLEAYGAKC